jgi:FAD/FMN-containing dehydrogenase
VFRITDCKDPKCGSKGFQVAALPAGRHFFRGDDGYEAARRGTVWHQRVPEHYPALIVQAVDADEIVAGLRYARANGHRVSIVSGGHSFAASHLRDGAVLLDVSRLDHATIDAERGVAVVGPGKGGSPLMADLEAQGLFFPGGHCKGVCVGGYLLQGGYGWNSRIYGPACESVVGLDVITADGEKIHCDADNHGDLYWAARGAGPGFFGVVTSFYLKLYPRPAVCGTSVYVYPWDVADQVYTWARRISAEVDRRVELQALATRSVAEMGIDAPGIVFASPAFADSEEEAEKALAIFGTCPVVDRAMVKVPYLPSDLPTWYTAVMTHYLNDHRYTADNMWTSAAAEELLPGIRTILDTMPPHPSHFLWLNWGPSPPRQDMAYSVEDEIYLALYGSWKDAADDDKYGDWALSNMAAMSHLATGIQLADENLGRRPAKFATDEAMARLDKARATYDPDGLFNSWMGRL